MCAKCPVKNQVRRDNPDTKPTNARGKLMLIKYTSLKETTAYPIAPKKEEKKI
jgi:hypothetical protein